MEEKMMESGKCEGGACGDGKCGEGVCCGKGNGMCGGKYGCRCMHHMVKPLLTILLGSTIVAWGWGYLESDIAAIMVGGFIIFAGLHKMFAGMCKCC